jgi:hypothetical protein
MIARNELRNFLCGISASLTTAAIRGFWQLKKYLKSPSYCAVIEIFLLISLAPIFLISPPHYL